MSRLHYHRDEIIASAGRPRLRIIWLSGQEWRGLLLIAGRHEIGLRLGGIR